MRSNSIFIVLFCLLTSAIQVVHAQYETNLIREAGNAGGKSEFNRIYKQELIYPEASLIAGIGGKVTYAFMIGKDGTLSNFRLIHTLNEELDNEALRLIRIMQWEPISKSGEKWDSQMEFTIVFDPQKYPKICKKRAYEKIEFPYSPIDTSLVVQDKMEQFPKFNNKGISMSEFFRDNLKYPKEAAIKNIQGTVIISFVVEQSGMITNIAVQQHVGGGCSEEAIRLVSLTKWTPGIKDNKAVRAKMKLPISFKYEINAK
ncbi:MAG: TonB family protein [Bacteroidetes bacterium]|nr:TonB family protein [Bacteroidota bacterium]HET6244279.1 energy transducer TonB [Bacteroidia bacterium]